MTQHAFPGVARILVIDDEETVRRGLVSILVREGHIAEGAGSAEEPLAVVFDKGRVKQITGLRSKRPYDRQTLEPEGDGTVPLALATLPGARHWFVAEKHGGLPNNGKVIAAVVDLLRTGSTERLPSSTRRSAARKSRTVSESVLRRVAPRKVRWQDLSPDARRRLLEPVISPEFHGAVASDALRPTPGAGAAVAASSQRLVELRLVRGNIADANARALVVGVFRSVDPSGASAAIDARLGGG